jgi:hypothetical protein
VEKAGAALLLAEGVTSAQPAPLDPGRFLLRTLSDLVETWRVGSANPHLLEAGGYCNAYGRGALDYHRAIVPPDAPPPFCGPSSTEPSTMRALRRLGRRQCGPPLGPRGRGRVRLPRPDIPMLDPEEV